MRFLYQGQMKNIDRAIENPQEVQGYRKNFFYKKNLLCDRMAVKVMVKIGLCQKVSEISIVSIIIDDHFFHNRKRFFGVVSWKFSAASSSACKN